jgi:hypothetical protein
MYVMAAHIGKLLCTARCSSKHYGGAAYMLYGNVRSLHTRGFLYAPYRVRALEFLVPSLLHAVGKAIVVGTQCAPVTQVVMLFAFDLILLAAVCIYRPYMDRALNVVHIAIAVMAVVNSTLLLLFSNVFRLPVRCPILSTSKTNDDQPLANGISGIVFFFANLLFYTALLLATVHAAARALMPGLGRSSASIASSGSAAPPPRQHAPLDDREQFLARGAGVGLDGPGIRAVAAAADDDDDDAAVAPVVAEREESREMGFSEAAEVLAAIAAAVDRSGESRASEFGSGSSAGGKLAKKASGRKEAAYVAVVGRLGRWASVSK